MIVISTSSFGKLDNLPLKRLEEAGYDVRLNPHGRTLGEIEIVELASDANGLIAGTEMLTRQVMEQLPELKVISRCGTGIDNVDLMAARELGIQVFRTPEAPAQAVAELAVGLILDMLRRISFQDRQVRAGVWQKQMGNLLRDKNVGIVGFGNIGQRVSEMLATFGTQLAYCDPEIDAATSNCTRKSLEALLAWADIVTIHVSGKQQLFGQGELAKMKQGSFLLNCARGGLIDEIALYEALKTKHLSGAALDVYAHEPYSGPLTELDNVILTPHIGSYAKESRVEMELQSVNNLIEGFND